MLGQPARRITVADIILAVDEPIDTTSCSGKENCRVGPDGKKGKCMTHELWASLNRTIIDFLDSVSLQDLVDQQRMAMVNQVRPPLEQHMVMFPAAAVVMPPSTA